MASLADLYGQQPNAGVGQVPLPSQHMTPAEKYAYVQAQLRDAQSPAYASPSPQGGIVGPSPRDVQFAQGPITGPTRPSDIEFAQTPSVMGPGPGDIRVMPAANREAIARALMHARQRGRAKYAVDVGTPQIAPQYNVEVGAPQIQESPAAVAARAANDARIRAAIAAKLTRAPVLGIKDDSLLGMDQLARVGIGAQQNAAGIPYGLDLNQLNGVERGWLQRQAR